MILHDDDDDDDLQLRIQQFLDQDDLNEEQLQSLAEFLQVSFYYLRYSSHSQFRINEDEDTRIRSTEVSVVSDTESNTELDHRSSLVDEESHRGSEHKIEEENQEDLGLEDEEGILLRLTEVSLEPDPELVDLPQGLDARRRVAEEEIHGGFKHKIEKENQVHFSQDPAYVQYDIKEEEDILRQLESESEFKTEQNDNRSYDEILRRLKESVRVPARQYKFKKEQKDLHICSNCLRRLPAKESDGGIKQRMDEAIQEKLHGEAEDPLTMFMKSVLASVNAGENRDSKCHRRAADKEIEERKQKYLDKDAMCFPHGMSEDEDRVVRFLVSLIEAVDARKKEQKEVQGDLKGELKQKMTTEKVDPFDLGTLQDLEEIVLKFYQFIDHIITMLKDTSKVRFELQDKLKFLQKVNDLLLTSSNTVNKLIKELERMKNDEKNHGKTQNVPEILVQLMELNADLVGQSFHHGIGILFDNKCRKNELSDCVKGLNRSRENLGTVLMNIREVINVKRMEDGNSREKWNKMKNKRFGFNASPQLPDGYEK